MKKLLQEIHERSLWQVPGLYLAGAWLLLQVVVVLNQNPGLPQWVFQLALILLGIGLPVLFVPRCRAHGQPAGRGGHVPPMNVVARHTLEWLDRYLGE